jgi:hypothetical protein
LVKSNQHIIALSRWTPFSCAAFGALGLALQSPTYFLILGICTSIGAFSKWSFYDYIHKFVFASLLQWGPMPQHQIHRRIGCGIGAIIYLTTSTGFYFQNAILAFLPASLIIGIAITSGFTGWCFVTSVAHMLGFKSSASCSVE